MPMTRLFARPVLVLICLWAVLVLPGCGKGGGSAGSAVASDSYENVYTVRAEVIQVPDGSPGGQFMARHETIPDYVSANGSVGMHAMVMPFTIVDPAVLKDISVGDIVEITFGETHRPRVSQGVIAIKKLPADTVLDFGEAGE